MRPDAAPNAAAVTKLAVTVWIDPNAATFTGSGTYDLRLPAGPVDALVLRGRGLRIDHATALIDGRQQALAVELIDDALTLRPAAPLPDTTTAVRLHLRWTGALQTRAEGVFTTRIGGKAHVFFWPSAHGPLPFPCPADPQQAASLSLSLHVPMGCVAVANTRALDRRGADASICWRFATSAPLPTTAMGFAVGPLNLITGPDGAVPLRCFGATAPPPWSVIRAALADHAQTCGRPWPDPLLNVVIAPDLPTPTRTAAGLIFVQPEAVGDPDAWRIALARGWFGRLVRFADPALAEACAQALAAPDALEVDDPTGLRAALAALSPADRAAVLAGCVRRGAHGPCRLDRIHTHARTADARDAIQTALRAPATGIFVDQAAPDVLRLRVDAALNGARLIRLQMGAEATVMPFVGVLRGAEGRFALPFAPAWLQPTPCQLNRCRLTRPALEAVLRAPQATRWPLPALLWRHFEWGVIEADTLLDQLLTLLAEPTPRALRQTAIHLARFADQLVPTSHHAALMRCLAQRIDPLLTPDLDPTTRAALLALRVRAPHAALALNLRAEAEASLEDSTADLHALPWAAASTGDAALFDAIVAALPTDPRHGALVRALGHFTDPALIDRAVGLLNTPGMRAPDLMRLLRPIARGRAGRDRLRALIEQHHAHWLRMVDHSTLSRLPDLAAGARTASERSAWATAFATGALRAPHFAARARRALTIIDTRIRLGARASAPLRARLSVIQPN